MPLTQGFRKRSKLALKAIIVRLIFAFHTVAVVYRVVVAWQNQWLWLLLLTLLLLIVETIVTFKKRKGKEWVRFSPAILLYLLAAIPPIWLLEIRRLQSRTVRESNITCLSNSSHIDNLDSKLNRKFGLCIDLGQWAIAMEQALLFIVIFGKWFMPKGNITKNQLSQILLVYVGTGADIMELFDGFDEHDKITKPLLITTLSLWSWALLQFCFTVTTKSNSIKQSSNNSENMDDCNPTLISETWWKLWFKVSSYNLEILGILSTILMQDGPFLVFRLYLLSGRKAVSQTMVFFTCKNILVISLQVYRLIVIYYEEKQKLRRHNTHLELSAEKKSTREENESKIIH